MKCVFALILCIAIPFAVFAADTQNDFKVTYDGGSLPEKAGSSAKLYIDTTTVRLVKDNTDIAAIPASAITEISYGQDVHRRVGAAIGLAVISFGIGGLMALTKSKKRHTGLSWLEGDSKGGFAT